MKKILIFFIALFSGLLVVTSVQAQLGLRKLQNETNRLQNKASFSAAKEENRLVILKQKADTMIANRINELNRLLARVQTDQKLSTEDRASLAADIQANINGLTALKTKIDGDTDLATAKADAKQIITNYYIYKMFVPKMRLLIIINSMQKLTSNLQTITPQLQNLINTAKSQGKDVTKLQALLDDINSRLQTISTTLANDKVKIQGVTAATAEPLTIFSQVRKDLADIRASFAQIRHDVAQIRPLFQGALNIKSNTTSSTSAQ